MKFRLKFCILTFVSVILALAVFLFVLLISQKNHHKFDLTSEHIYSLSPQSVQTVQEIKDPIEALVFLAESDFAGREKARELLDNYNRANDKLTYRFVDPLKSPATAKKYDIRMPGTIILEKGKKTQRVQGVAEEELTNALLAMDRSSMKKVYFLKGHGEMGEDSKETSSFSQFRSAMTSEGFASDELSLLEKDSVPEDASVLVIAAPKAEMAPVERQRFTDWLDKGGRVFLMLGLDSGTKYDWLLEKFDLRCPDEMIIDVQAALAGAEPVYAIATAYNSDAVITRNFSTLTVFKMARPITSIEHKEGEESNISIIPLAYTGVAYTVANDNILNKDLKDVVNQNHKAEGSMPLAAAATYKVGGDDKAAKDKADDKTDNTKLVKGVFTGNADFVSNELFGAYGNRDFAMNILNWLTESENRITIRPRNDKTAPIIISDRNMTVIKVLLIFAIPLAVFLVGLSNVRKRGR